MPNQARLTFLEWLANQEAARRAEYALYRDYYDGEHSAQLTERLKKFLNIKSGLEFNLNLCPVVVDSLAERLVVTGFDAGEQSATFWSWWEQNDMDGVQADLHLSAVRDGDGYILVDWDEGQGRPAFWHELACDGDGVTVHYGERRKEPIFASKRWRVESENPGEAGKVRRLNLYYPNRIEKYIDTGDRKQGDGRLEVWAEFSENSGDPWPIPWTMNNKPDGEPIGVPVVHFRNRAQGYNHGQSELKSVLGPQNGLNKSVIDLLSAADTGAFGIRWVTGGDTGGADVYPGAIYSFDSSDTRVGTWEAMDLSQLINMVNQFKLWAAQVSRTPISAFQITGQIAAEGTLKQQESGLVAKAENRQVFFGNSWERVMELGRRLNNVFGNEEMNEEQNISTQWASAETRSALDDAQVAAVYVEKLGVPRAMAWAKAGFTQAEIEEMLTSDEHQARLELMRSGMARGARDAELGRQLDNVLGGMREGGQDDDEEENERIIN